MSEDSFEVYFPHVPEPAQISVCDAMLFFSRDWRITKPYTDSAGKYHKRRMYERGSGNTADRAFHRIVLQTPDGMFTDHINGNGLDNRRSNLRNVTPQQNAMNTGKKPGTSSKYKGVSYDYRQPYKKWRATINKEGKKYHLGFFETEKDAAEAYIKASKTLHGEYSNTKTK